MTCKKKMIAASNQREIAYILGLLLIPWNVQFRFIHFQFKFLLHFAMTLNKVQVKKCVWKKLLI